MRFKMIFIFLAIFLVLIGAYFFAGRPPQAEKIVWGMNFSQKHAQNLGLDWRENYSALLDNLGVRNLKIITHWDLIEKEKNTFSFSDLDWQIKKAKENEAEAILVIGVKTGRWPECHIPEWAEPLSQQKQQERILRLLEKIVSRYLDSETIWAWQVENEPLFPFGECQWKDREFLEEEINLVKELDPERPIIFSDSGEGSFWFTAARLADIVGITMYQKVWFEQLGRYVSYPFPPVFYWRKAQIIKSLFEKKVMVTELQAEPWGPKLLYDISLDEQKKTMNLSQFRQSIDFARKTGFDSFYLWGGEWWYWLKEKHYQPAIWEEAKKIF